ncbi:MAG: TetR/AcrR family transcriptional regulator [Deltaproteobacteria bacterium]|nr:TetR/AcrR family transcriptional regulator [Deltaproteobacteria bacterium]
MEPDAEAPAPAVDPAADAPSKPSTPPKPEKPPRFRRRKGARPEELISAAVALFAEQGFAATNLKDVAKRAGVSKGTVYLYFRSKEDLLRAAVRTSVVPIVDVVDELEVDADGTASELLGTLLRRWVAEFDERGVAGVPKLVMAEANNFPELAEDYVSSVLSRVRRLVARVLKRGVRDGEFASIDVREATHLLLAPVFWAQLHGASLAPFDDGGPDLADFVESHLAYFLRSVASKETR